MTILEANRLGADIHREILQSLSSADRYPRGTVSLLDTQLVAELLPPDIRDADPVANPRLADMAGIERTLQYRVTAYSPSITRLQLLQMPLALQVESFGLSFAEAVDLRRALTDFREPTGPRPVPERLKIPVPLLTGMPLREATLILSAAGLVLGDATVVDSPLPSGSVVAQEPTAGVTVDFETEISLQFASGLSVRLPEVIGLGLAEAACRVRDAGLRSEPNIEGRPVPEARVAALDPPAGTLVTPHAPVTIRLEAPTAWTAPR